MISSWSNHVVCCLWDLVDLYFEKKKKDSYYHWALSISVVKCVYYGICCIYDIICVCLYIHTYIHTYIYIYFISIKRFFLPTFWAENTFCLFFLLTVPRCVKSRPGSVIDSLLCIPFFFSVLVSRQFVDMSRIRIEGLLAAFPKLVGTGKQHTYVETENVRYVYQPIEALYLLLVTNKQSNILEDLETLRLLSKLVSFSWWYIFQFMFLYWVQHDFFDPPILDI